MSKLDIRQEERIKNKWSKAKKWIGGILAIVVIVTISAIGFGGNYLYNLALNPDTPKDIIFASTESKNDVVTINGSFNCYECIRRKASKQC